MEVLKRLEASPVCQSLAMHSFLMLPMQRITRLPLLVDAIFHRLDSGTPQFERCRQTLATLNKVLFVQLLFIYYFNLVIIYFMILIYLLFNLLF